MFVDTYGTNASQVDTARYRSYNKTYARECNPSPDGETMSLLPFPRCRMRINDEVPEIFYQITGVRAEVRNPRDNTTIRWLRIQNSRYVALPWEWAEKNIHKDIITEAICRGVAKFKGLKKTGISSTFIKLPPGDARDDDPPINIRDVQKGLNYYYQGQIDNCLMGGFANAIFRMMGSDLAKELLETWSPQWHLSDDRWTKFQEHASQVLSRNIRTVVFHKQVGTSILALDDSMPILVQLRGKDESETHAITVYKNNIYNGAS